MPGLTPTRTEISDRFSVLGFRVRSGRSPYYEVAIATDPALFHPDAKSQRTGSNFYSTHGIGPLQAERGEAMYFVPPHILRHFAGKERIYYTIAAFQDTSRVNPEILDLPDQTRPWVTISRSFTGREIRRLVGAPSRHHSPSGNGYGGKHQELLVWAGDDVAPGTIQRVEPTAANASPSPGNAQPSAPAPIATNGSKPAAQAPAAKASSLSNGEYQYDDGYGQEFWAQQQEEDTDIPPEASQYGIDAPIPDGGDTSVSQSLAARALDISPEYPQALRFAPAAKGNYYPRSSPRTINRIVIHITDGQPKIEGTIAWFQTPNQMVNGKRVYASSHYVVGQQGEVVQMVRHQDIAYHASSANPNSIGIEHVARSPHEWKKSDPGFKPTDAEYCASATLVRWLCGQFNLPMDRDHIVGHNEADPNTTHTDCPTGAWDWDYYMGLVSSETCVPHSDASDSQPYSQTTAAPRKVSMSAAPKKKLSTTRALEVVKPDYVPSGMTAALQTQLDFQNRYQQWVAGVSDTSFFPHSAICQLVRDDGGFGTGTYIAADRILTAAHVVEGANSITVIPGKNGQTGNNGPFGTFACPSSDWAVHPKRVVGNEDFDIAVLKVGTPPPGGQFFDILEELRQSLPSNIIVCGYSAQSDKDPSLSATIDPNKQHLDGDAIRTVQDETFTYNLQTLHGASGAAVYYVWARDDDARQQCVLETHLVGVHVSGLTDTLNRGCRLTDDKIAWIRSIGQPISAGASAQAYSAGNKHAKAQAQMTAGAKPLVRAASAGAVQSYGASTTRMQQQKQDKRQPTAKPLQAAVVVPAVATIAGTVLTRILDNSGDIKWELDQLKGLKHPHDDPKNAGTAPYVNGKLDIPGPIIENGFTDQIYANFEIKWQYNGHSLGNMTITPIQTNDAIAWGLTVKALINDDANAYPSKSGGECAAIQIRFTYVFDRILLSDRIYIYDFTLHGDGTFDYSGSWTQ
jgi:V8-like Glu-specific endopeptidase